MLVTPVMPACPLVACDHEDGGPTIRRPAALSHAAPFDWRTDLSICPPRQVLAA